MDGLIADLALLQWLVSLLKKKGAEAPMPNDMTTRTIILRHIERLRGRLEQLEVALTDGTLEPTIPRSSLDEPRRRARKAINLLPLKRWLSRYVGQRHRGTDLQRTAPRRTSLLRARLSGGDDWVQSFGSCGAERTSEDNFASESSGHIHHAQPVHEVRGDDTTDPGEFQMPPESVLPDRIPRSHTS